MASFASDHHHGWRKQAAPTNVSILVPRIYFYSLIYNAQLFHLEMKSKIFKNAILQANIRSQIAKEIDGDAVYIMKQKNIFFCIFFFFFFPRFFLLFTASIRSRKPEPPLVPGECWDLFLLRPPVMTCKTSITCSENVPAKNIPCYTANQKM